MTTSPPPPAAEELRRWVISSPSELQVLRAQLHATLLGHEPGDGDRLADVPERMLLVVTELATNAMKHGLPPTEIRLLRSETQFMLDVADRDLDRVPEVNDDAENRGIGGRGLMIARSLSLDVGWYATEDAKHIWATFPTHGEESPDDDHKDS